MSMRDRVGGLFSDISRRDLRELELVFDRAAYPPEEEVATLPLGDLIHEIESTKLDNLGYLREETSSIPPDEKQQLRIDMAVLDKIGTKLKVKYKKNMGTVYESKFKDFT